MIRTVGFLGESMIGMQVNGQRSTLKSVNAFGLHSQDTLMAEIRFASHSIIRNNCESPSLQVTIEWSRDY